MKVAYLLGSLNRGGTETLLLDVFRNSIDASFPFIGIHRKDGVLHDDFYATSVPFFCCRPQRFRLFSYLFRLRRLLIAEQITIVHAQQYIDALYAHFATIGTSIRIVQTFHGYDTDCTSLQCLLMRWSMRVCSATCFVSNTQRKYYLQHYKVLKPKKTYVVYNGIDFAKLDTADLPNPALPTKIDPAQRGMKLGMVGNFVSVRSQNSLLQFLLRIHNEKVPFDFYFIGKRNEDEAWRYDECVQFCKQYQLTEVHFLGSRSDVSAILHQLDAFLYATDHDTFGIAVVEAIAAGLPVFVNDHDVMTEITHEGEWAILYHTHDTNDLCRKFHDFCQSPETYRQQAAIAAKAVRGYYSIAHHLQQLQLLYDTL